MTRRMETVITWVLMAPIIAFGVMAWGAVVVFILALLGYIK